MAPLPRAYRASRRSPPGYEGWLLYEDVFFPSTSYGSPGHAESMAPLPQIYPATHRSSPFCRWCPRYHDVVAPAAAHRSPVHADTTAPTLQTVHVLASSILPHRANVLLLENQSVLALSRERRGVHAADTAHT